jgi:hypothetical protein
MLDNNIEQSAKLLQETRELISRLIVRSEQLIRETQQLSAKMADLSDDHLDEVVDRTR